VRAAGPSKLFRNLHDGTVRGRRRGAGVARDDSLAAGPLFFDYDGDGWPDLFVGAVEDGGLAALSQPRDGTFQDVDDGVRNPAGVRHDERERRRL
jgi:hypothetical protein